MSRGKRLAWLTLALAGACSDAPSATQAEAFAASLASTQASLAVLRPDRAADPAPPLRAPAARPRLGDEAPGTRPGSAAQLMGAGPEALRRWLGEPSLRRTEGRAEIWLYLSQGCALDLVLYREGSAMKVAHASARAQGAASQTEGACLRQISAAAATRSLPAAQDTAPRREPGV